MNIAFIMVKQGYFYSFKDYLTINYSIGMAQLIEGLSKTIFEFCDSDYFSFSANFSFSCPKQNNKQAHCDKNLHFLI